MMKKSLNISFFIFLFSLYESRQNTWYHDILITKEIIFVINLFLHIYLFELLIFSVLHEGGDSHL